VQHTWLAAHHACARDLHLRISDHDRSRTSALPALAMVGPSLERLFLHSTRPPPERVGWLRHLGPGLTRLVLDGINEEALGAALALGGGAADLDLELPAGPVGGRLACVRPAPGGAQRALPVTRLKIHNDGDAAPPDDDYWRALGGLTPSLERLELEADDRGRVPAPVRRLTALTALPLPWVLQDGAEPPQAPADLLAALRELPRLARLEYCPTGVPSSSAVASLTALRELRVRVIDTQDPAVEAGAYLGRLERLEVASDWHCLCPFLAAAAARQCVVELLRGATALTSLAFATRHAYTWHSNVHLNTARVDAVLAGKPALRRFELQKEHAHALDLDLEALRARHPAVKFVLGGREWWAPPPPRGAG
jgi:hypothetical protein